MWRYLLHSVWTVAGGASVLPAGVTDRGKASKEAGVDLGPSLSSFFFFKSTTDGEETKKKTKIKKKQRRETKQHATRARVSLCVKRKRRRGVLCRVASRCVKLVCVSRRSLASTGTGCSWRMFSSAPLVHFSPPQSAARASPSPSPRHDN